MFQILGEKVGETYDTRKTTRSPYVRGRQTVRIWCVIFVDDISIKFLLSVLSGERRWHRISLFQSPIVKKPCPEKSQAVVCFGHYSCEHPYWNIFNFSGGKWFSYWLVTFQGSFGGMTWLNKFAVEQKALVKSFGCKTNN